jgi:hypothetical protein
MNTHTPYPVFSPPPCFSCGDCGDCGDEATEATPLQGFSVPTISDSVPKQWGLSPLEGLKVAFLTVLTVQVGANILPRPLPGGWNFY